MTRHHPTTKHSATIGTGVCAQIANRRTSASPFCFYLFVRSRNTPVSTRCRAAPPASGYNTEESEDLLRRTGWRRREQQFAGRLRPPNTVSCGMLNAHHALSVTVGPAVSGPPSPTCSLRTSTASPDINAMMGGMLKRFSDMGRMIIEAMKVAGATGDIMTLHRQARALKSASGPPGAVAVSVAANTLQDAIKQAAATHVSGEEISGELAALLTQVDKEFESFVAAMKPKRPTRSLNRYAADTLETQRTMTDHEQHHKMKSWNKRIYEKRVTKAYVEERLVCSLYQQAVQKRSQMQRASHLETCRLNQAWSDHFRSPYTMKKLALSQTLGDLRESRKRGPPQFSDLDDDILPRLRAQVLTSRGQSADRSAIARPASPRSLSRQVQLPPIGSLMNPPFSSVMSDVPRHLFAERRAISESSSGLSRGKSRGGSGADELRALTLPTVLRTIALVYDGKIAADAQTRLQHINSGQVAEGARLVDQYSMPMGEALKVVMYKYYGNEAAKKTDELKAACHPTAHGSHPRVALFTQWVWPETEWPRAKLETCAMMVSWLRIATSKPDERDSQLLLSLKDASKMAVNLQRLALVPHHGVAMLLDTAKELAAALAAAPSLDLPPSPNPQVDADELLLEWMARWNEWEDDGLSRGLGLDDEDEAQVMAEVAAVKGVAAPHELLPEGSAAAAPATATALKGSREQHPLQ